MLEKLGNKKNEEFIDYFFSLMDSHESYRNSILNLIPSENIMSLHARRILSSDLVHRYSDSDFYGGGKYIDEIVEVTVSLAKSLFRSKFAFIEPLSGNISHIAVIMAFSKSGDKIANIAPEYGGYPFRYRDFEREPIYLPFDRDEFNVDIESVKEIITKEKPKVVFLGSSIILFPHPVKEISEIAHDVGAVVAYDGSHVLGLIAGGEFQDPLGENADVLLGSTHKTFPGPQGGIILCNDEDIARRIGKILMRPPLLVDNIHLHRIGALAITLIEMLIFGKEYARQIIKNSKTLARYLYKNGIEVGYKEKDFTQSHQILYPQNLGDGLKIRNMLEKAGIIVDKRIRIGTQEVTRLGMKCKEMRAIADFIHDAIVKKKIDETRIRVKQFVSKYRSVYYSLDVYLQEREL